MLIRLAPARPPEKKWLHIKTTDGTQQLVANCYQMHRRARMTSRTAACVVPCYLSSMARYFYDALSQHSDRRLEDLLSRGRRPETSHVAAAARLPSILIHVSRAAGKAER